MSLREPRARWAAVASRARSRLPRVEASSTTITVCAKADGTVIVNDGSSDSAINRIELANTVRPLLEKKRTEKLVFVDFEDQVAYTDAVSVMDTLTGLGKIVDKDTKSRDVKIALKIRDEMTKTDPCRTSAE